MESRVGRAICNPSINFQRPNFVSLIHSFLLPLIRPATPHAFFSVFVISLEAARLQAARNDGIDILLAENLHSLFIYQYNTPSCFFFDTHSTFVGLCASFFRSACACACVCVHAWQREREKEHLTYHISISAKSKQLQYRMHTWGGTT